jgi:AcrR family transcriptional regulator
MAAAGRSSGQKGRILDFASDLFFRYGFKRVTIDEITAELRMSKTTFYRYFKSKEDLLAKVIREYYARIHDGISDIMTRSVPNYLEELTSVLLFIGKKLGGIDSRALQDIRSSAPRTWQTLQELQHRMVHAAIEKVLHQGVEAGVVRPNVDAKLMANMIVMNIESVFTNERLRTMSLSVHEGIQAIVDVFLKGILTDREDTRSWVGHGAIDSGQGAPQ